MACYLLECEQVWNPKPETFLSTLDAAPTDSPSKYPGLTHIDELSTPVKSTVCQQICQVPHLQVSVCVLLRVPLLVYGVALEPLVRSRQIAVEQGKSQNIPTAQHRALWCGLFLVPSSSIYHQQQRRGRFKVIWACTCHPGFFKAFAGNIKCSKCPPHSFSFSEGSAVCRCETGFYRADKDPPTMACTRE
ncbi:hypothetical protein WMY93_017534 [Mugilogobius chulae]|uniref:Tyrosine-protein kinase ephrin type A/B receptor-like domain-containing protein n=1 Tax=Mugilogobius chulae TaxID=88201 RepID=A0AAW0NTE4_9GOBI